MYVYESNYALINAVSKDCLCQCLSSILRLCFSERDSSPTLNSALLHAQRGPDLTETDIGKIIRFNSYTYTHIHTYMHTYIHSWAGIYINTCIYLHIHVRSYLHTT